MSYQQPRSVVEDNEFLTLTFWPYLKYGGIWAIVLPVIVLVYYEVAKCKSTSVKIDRNRTLDFHELAPARIDKHTHTTKYTKMRVLYWCLARRW